MGDSERDTSRAVVQTYVPAYQRDNWDEHAEQLEMNRSEFVRTMVQAGRRGFGADIDTDSADGGNEDSGTDDSLEEQVRETLASEGPLSWDALLAAVTGDIETRLEETLEQLQKADKLHYSGRQGGYVLDGGEDT